MLQMKTFQKLVQLEQTLFSLPLAFAAVALAFYSQESTAILGIKELLIICFWVVIAIFSGRTAGMSLNRLIDCKIDAQNPRTKDRLLPSGLVSRQYVQALIVVSYIIFFLACYVINPLCFLLSPVVAIALFMYSFLKRFTALCHFGMGLVHFFVPVCAWIAITGEWSIAAVYLGLSAFFRITASDILYAFQDFDFDRGHKVYSLPSAFGKNIALCISGAMFLATLACLVILGMESSLNFMYYVGIVFLGSILFWQWKEVFVKGGEGIAKAFFSCNALFPILLFVFVLLGLL